MCSIRIRTLLSLALFSAVALVHPACRRVEEPLNVVLITLDTVRADHLTPYGYARDTVPALDAFVDRAVQFRTAITSCTMTAPSHATILTGRHWGGHGVVTNGWVLDEDNLTLAEMLADEGYRTGGFVSARWVLGRRFGFDQGFELFEEGDRLQRRAESVVDGAVRYLDGVGDDPFFVWMHFYDPHCPYTPPEPYASRFTADTPSDIDPTGKCGKTDYNKMDLQPSDVDYLRGLYDGELAYLDDQLRRFFAYVEQRGLIDDTLFVITADHGEGLGEQGKIGHNLALRRWETRVPLWIRGPQVEPGVVDGVVSTADITPTIARLLELEQRPVVDGRDLTPLLPRRGAAEEVMKTIATRPIFSFTGPNERSPNKSMVRLGRWKLIWTQGSDARLYELTAGVAHPVDRKKRPEVYRKLRTRMDGWVDTQTELLEHKPDVEIPDAVREKLEALGYAG